MQALFPVPARPLPRGAAFPQYEGLVKTRRAVVCKRFPMSRPTLYDVAQHAGVSPATVSRVVNGSARDVGEALRARVLSAATELGYVPHGPAQALARASS